jgi:hypothetical protein
MDDLENTPPAQPEPEPVTAQYDSLRQLVVWMLVLLIVISGTLNVFLLRQARTSRQELEAARPQVSAIMNQFEKLGPAMDEFVHKLVAFSKTHPDFAPILNRHLQPSQQTAPPAATPIPIPAAVPSIPAKAQK